MISKLLNTYRKIPLAAKASLWFAVCSVLQKSVSMITVPIFTRLMNQAQYGQFSVYNSWLQIFTIITTLRLNYAVFEKGITKYSKDKSSFIATIQSTTSILTALCFIVYLLFLEFINDITGLPTIVMLAMFVELLFTPAISFWTINERFDFKYKSVVFVSLLITILNACIGVVAVVISEEKGIARILSCILVNVIIGGVIYFSNFVKAKKKFVKEYAKFAVLFNIPLLPHYLSIYVLSQFDRIMIQKMCSLSQVGIYSVAYNIGLLTQIVTSSINNSLIPWQYKKLGEEKLLEMKNVVYPLVFAVGIVLTMLVIFAPEIVYIFAGESYMDAIYVIPPVALSVLFTFAYTIFLNIEIFYDENKFTMYISMIAAVLNIALNYIGIKLFGYVAAAYTTLLSYMLISVGHFYFVRYVLKRRGIAKEPFSAKITFGMQGVFLTVNLIMIAFYNMPIVRYSMIVVICVVIIIFKNRIVDIINQIRATKK